MKPKPVPYEVIEKAVCGDTELKEVLNAKLLEAVLKFFMFLLFGNQADESSKPLSPALK